MKFIKIKDKKSEKLELSDHTPIKVYGRNVCAVHNDTDS